MSSNERGGISKLIIKAYPDNKFASSKGEYTASINPEDLNISGGVDYHLSQGMGSPGTLRYNTSSPKVLSFKLLFDNTGIIPGSEAPVEEQLDRLKKIIYEVQENINSPYYVRIIWGVIDFKGRLTDLDINYTRFKAEGRPIRAEATIRVIEEIEAPVNTKKSSQATSQFSKKASKSTASKGNKTASAGAQVDSKASAATNNTKVHQVKDGESLPGLSKESLGDPNLAPSLANLNGLDSLRGLDPGLALALPFGLAALLAALLAAAVSYAEQGAEWVQEKV